MSNAAIVEKNIDRREPYSIALKIEKAFELAQTDVPHDDVDETTAQVTRALKMIACKQNDEEMDTPQEDDEILCCQCQKIGYFGKDFIWNENGKSSIQRSRKALLGKWREISEEKYSTKDNCMMARSDTTEVNLELPDSSEFSNTDFVDVINGLLKENERLNQVLSEKEEYIAGLIEDNQSWAEKAMNLEEEKRSHKCKCKTCARHLLTISDLEDKLTQSEKDHNLISRRTVCNTCDEHLLKIENLGSHLKQLESDNIELTHSLQSSRTYATEMKEKWVKDQHGMRSEETSKTSSEQFTKPGIGYHEKEDVLTNVSNSNVDALVKKACDDSCQQHPRGNSSLERLKYSSESTVPFNAKKAYAIWRKHSLNEKPFTIDFQAKKNDKSIPAGKSKYVGLKCQRVCWHCGKDGHYKSDCIHLKRLEEKLHHTYGVVSRETTEEESDCKIGRRNQAAGKAKHETREKLNDQNHGEVINPKGRIKETQVRGCGSARGNDALPNNHRKCWYCGKAGHYKRDCQQRSKSQNTNYISCMSHPGKTWKKPLKSQDKSNTFNSEIHNNSYVTSKPNQPKLVWVVKH